MVFASADTLDIDVTSASSAKWRSEYSAQYRHHRQDRSADGRRAAHWKAVAERRTAQLLEAETASRRQRGQRMPDNWPHYAIKFTHRQLQAEQRQQQQQQLSQPRLVSALTEMRTSSSLFVPVDATQRPVRVAAEA